jgi:hypothetical protein
MRKVFVGSLCLLFPAAVFAHPHTIESNGQVIANGQNHPAFVDVDPTSGVMFVSCDEFTHLPGYGPAWYGIETAHHGPDAGDPGKDEGCYMIEGGLSPLDPLADSNPAIK